MLVDDKLIKDGLVNLESVSVWRAIGECLNELTFVAHDAKIPAVVP